jgi:V/A-type H+-transporting ATPase subunit I
MAIVEMQKIHILSLKQHQEEILKQLQKHEVLDIQTMAEAETLGMEELGKHDLQLAEIKSAIAFLEGISKKKKSFIEGFIPPKEEIGEAELLQTCSEFDCGQFLEKSKGIENELVSIKSLKNELQADIGKLIPWRSLAAPLNDLGCTPNTCIATGKIRTGKFEDFKYKFEKFTNAVEMVIARRTREETYLIIIYLTAETTALSDFLSKTEFEPISLPVSDNSPQQEILKLRSLLNKADIQLNEYLEEAQQLLRHLNKLKYLYDLILSNKATLEAQRKFINTRYTFVIEGWIKKSDSEKLRRELLKVSKEIEIFKIQPAEGEKPPVVLKNPGILSPFELITSIYGTPKSDELDPTGPLSFFFALFFGICLGDFGYGLVLALFAVYFLKKYKLSRGGIKLMRLLFLGGGVSALVGLLTGSYLGLSPAEIPAYLLPLKSFLTSVQIIDPIKNPLNMLVFSLALGVVQILFGIILQMVHKIMNKQITDALLDDGLWLFFLGSLVFLIVSNAVAAGTIQTASYLSIAGAVALVLTQGRHKKNIIQKFFSGLLSLYKVSGYMGDTLSYSRLLALGMSTTIIGSVINILAGMVKGGVPVLGIVLMIVLLIVGHIFNLIIGTLGAFVHSTRLQMVEFFSKFYEGGGREFRPFKREAEFTILKQGGS